MFANGIAAIALFTDADAAEIGNALLIGLGIALVTVLVIVLAIKLKNKASPRVVGKATVLSKRTQTNRTVTMYFVAFQMDDGKRVELGVRGSEFGVLVEGDRGVLSYQGTQYLGFQRV